MSGKFVTFEGVDGGGKSTQARLLAEHLRAAYNIPVLETREPGGTAIGEKLRRIVLETDNKNAVTETLLMFAARREHLLQKIRPALAAGQWVVCDRFTDSSTAYQGGGRGVPLKLIETLAQYVQEETAPDLTIYIKSSPDLAASPLFSKIAFEKEKTDFYQRVEKMYNQLAKKEKRICVVDALGGRGAKRSKDAIQKEILDIVKKRLSPRRPV